MDHRVVVTAGHVDHGKSTVVRALTGMEPDRLAEERRRGLSIELGFVWGSLSSHDGRARTIAFVDVPGHQRFLATMLAGAGPAPAAMLIVAATDGWSAQTTDHVTALTLLGIPICATVVTKIDLVDAPCRRDVEDDVRQRLAAMGVPDTPSIPVDAAHHVGIDELAHCLVEQTERLPAAADYGRGRLWIDRVFTVAGAGAVVTGTLGDGVLTVGQEVRILPHGTRAKIRKIESLGKPVDQVNPGQRAAINVAGVDHHQIHRGDVVAADVAWPRTEVFDVQLLPADAAPFDRGAWHLHIGTTHLSCRVRRLGDTAARVTVDRPLPIATGDRFIVRDTGRRMIVAGGTVVDPEPVVRLGGPSERAAYGGQLAAVSTDDRRGCALALVALGGGVRRMDDLLAATGVMHDRLVVIGELVVTPERYDAWVDRVSQLGPGAHTREVVLNHVISSQVPAADADSLLAHLVGDGVLVRVTGGYALAGHDRDVRDAKHAAINRFLADLAEQPFAPEDLQTLLTRHGLDHRDVAVMLQQHTIVRAGRITFAASSVATAVAVLAERWPDDAPFTAAQAKEAWGTTRRFAIPLLEHLDRIGVTAFDGQHRVLRRTRISRL